ncbi:hypothetical protein DRO49_02595 [Candidatus Bathyarchaeota archaeon]|nr:MAG: hypothetical protein DRO49_02595 [Candidatus Bathyarchaeota archaeon]
MKADHIDPFLELGQRLRCDHCGRLCEEGYLLTSEYDEERRRLEKALRREEDVFFICEDCLYKLMSPETTRIYSCSGRRMRISECNLKGDI